MANSIAFLCCDCGHWDESGAANAKRCYVCRMIRNLTFVGERKSKCWLCDERFAPIARDDKVCGDCGMPWARDEQIQCAICDQTKHSVCKDIRVCSACARQPQHRRKLISALKEKRDLRVVHAPGPEPARPAEPTPTATLPAI